MPNLALVPTFLRELLVSRSFPREPEPDLVMDDPAQVAAYADAGRIDGSMAAVYIFHSARVCQVIQGLGAVLDLGCGPATQLAQIAELNPETRFTGVDLSAQMLIDARQHVQNLGLQNVTFMEGDITRLDRMADQSFDAVVSTMALHHLPTLDDLERCFAEVRRVLKPGGALYLTDFGRLKSLKSVKFFAYMDEEHQSQYFARDTERSLRAAFLKDDFREMVRRHFPDGVSVESTFKVPFLVIVKTRDRPLPSPLRERLSAMRKTLKPRYQRDLNDLRLFFALGGLRDDPFH